MRLIRIDKVFEGQYTASFQSSIDGVDYRCPELLPSHLLAAELLNRGAKQAEIDAAFAEADKFYIPPPVRQ